MPDTNEERLLSELLRDIANADETLAGSGELDRRVMAEWDARGAQPAGSRRGTPDSGRPTIPDRPWAAHFGAAALGAAALGTAALVLAVSVVMQLGFFAKSTRIDPARQTPPFAIATSRPEEVVVVHDAREPSRPLVRRAMPRRRQVVPQNDIVSFVPLVPMTADELSGSFSIARVQIGQTQADVLLGEDGMARAIRVSTNERTSPGRLK